MEGNYVRSENVRDYVATYKLEELLTKSMNQLVSDLPKDPFSFLCSLIKEKSMKIYTVTNVQMRPLFKQDFQKNIEVIITMSYQGNARETIRYVIPFSSTLYDKIKDNLEPFIEVYNTLFKNDIKDFQIDHFENFDRMLTECEKEIPKDDNIKKLIGPSIINNLSISTFISMAKIREEKLFKFVETEYSQGIINAETIPNLGFSLFKTGKSVNSKVKFERFIIFINNSSKMPKAELFDIIQRLYVSIRKNLTAGKQGENGLKLNNEGCYSAPVDNMNDIIKLMETIINEVNVPEKLFYGIDCNANNYFTPTTKTYEMDGFKKPPDTDQIIEFYQKLCNDHPLLQYLEEPIAQSDKDGWTKLKQIFNDNLPNIIISNKCYKEQNEEEDHYLNTEPKRQENLLTLAQVEERPHKTEATKDDNEEDNQDQLNVISCRLGQLLSISELLYTIQRLRLEGDLEVNLWDNEVETEQTAIIDLGIAFKVNNIILNGFSMKSEKLCKIMHYINTIEDIY